MTTIDKWTMGFSLLKSKIHKDLEEIGVASQHYTNREKRSPNKFYDLP